MEITITSVIRRGRTRFFPKCDTSLRLCAFGRCSTLSKQQLFHLEKLGYIIKIIPEFN